MIVDLRPQSWDPTKRETKIATCGNDRLLFVHVPKTGGSWVSAALDAAGVEVEKIGETPHSEIKDLDVRGRFTFAFVREPLSWYGSTWNYRRKHQPNDWRGRYWQPIDEWIQNLEFHDFLEKLIEDRPALLSRYYELYVGPPRDPIDFIGRYENLQEDLILALELAEQGFDEEALRAVAPVNTSAPTPPCPEEIRDRLVQSEKDAYERFYKMELA